MSFAKLKEGGRLRPLAHALNEWFHNAADEAADVQAFVTAQERAQAAFYAGTAAQYETQSHAAARYADATATLVLKEPVLTSGLVRAFKRAGLSFTLSTDQIRKLKKVANEYYAARGTARRLAGLPGGTPPLIRWMIATDLSSKPSAPVRFPGLLIEPDAAAHAHELAASLRAVATAARATIG